MILTSKPCPSDCYHLSFSFPLEESRDRAELVSWASLRPSEVLLLCHIPPSRFPRIQKAPDCSYSSHRNACYIHSDHHPPCPLLPPQFSSASCWLFLHLDSSIESVSPLGKCLTASWVRGTASCSLALDPPVVVPDSPILSSLLPHASLVLVSALEGRLAACPRMPRPFCLHLVVSSSPWSVCTTSTRSPPLCTRQQLQSSHQPRSRARARRETDSECPIKLVLCSSVNCDKLWTSSASACMGGQNVRAGGPRLFSDSWGGGLSFLQGSFFFYQICMEDRQWQVLSQASECMCCVSWKESISVICSLDL